MTVCVCMLRCLWANVLATGLRSEPVICTHSWAMGGDTNLNTSLFPFIYPIMNLLVFLSQLFQFIDMHFTCECFQVGPRRLDVQPWAAEKPSFTAELNRIVTYISRPQVGYSECPMKTVSLSNKYSYFIITL